MPIPDGIMYTYDKYVPVIILYKAAFKAYEANAGTQNILTVLWPDKSNVHQIKPLVISMSTILPMK